MRVRRRIRVTGVVQGVGFRPHVHSLATSLGLVGEVGNDSGGVLIEAEGDSGAISSFLDRLTREAPPMAVIESVEVSEVTPQGGSGFAIGASGSGVGATSIPPDTATCEDCLRELRDPSDRRFGYPFIACTNCGPRYTIVTGLPYDRAKTTMVDFPLCDACLGEYTDPTSRRFHAQPTACPDCGPRLSRDVPDVVADLRAGRIIAIKGVGGYHLACDAENAETVRMLRTRKQRGSKPFAVMARDLDVVERIAVVTDDAQAALRAPARPIVLLPSRGDSWQATLAPGNSFIGVMLPYAPLHHLLFDGGVPDLLVMTSGNLSDEPICIDEQEAVDRLSGIADAFCHHDRRIHVPCDDSVVRATARGVQPVRRSRGFAPMPLMLPCEAEHMVAVGGEVKTTIAVARGRSAWLSQHIGDTENLETLSVLERTVRTLTELQSVDPRMVVSDAHPGYLSRGWARDEARRRGIEHRTVQHHHAHAASLLAEHSWPQDQPVLAFAFDGTGYGADGTIWGGELLLATYGQAERVGHLAPIALPGGDAATRRVLRTALAHLRSAGLDWEDGLPPIEGATAGELTIVGRMLQTGAGCTPTTSMGRLFDAIASILGVRQDIDYEGQAAIELEALASTSAAAECAAWVPAVGYDEAGSVVLDPAPAVRAAVGSVRGGMPSGLAARAFHEGLAEGVVRAAAVIRADRGVDTVGLTGGVFANAVLGAGCRERLVREGFHVLEHRHVPPNDGGLALGQVAVAAAGGARPA